MKFKYLLGTHRLSRNPAVRTTTEDVLVFLQDCSDEHFLDFLEFIFSSETGFQLVGRDRLVGEINGFLRVDDLPYAVTDYVWVEKTQSFRGQPEQVQSLTEYPRVIRKDSEVVHRTALVPTLELLREPGYEFANKEFLEALEDYRKGDYGDCLTKCGSSFESVLKILCKKKGWPHTGDTAAPLLRAVIDGSGLESFFEAPLIVVATIRNKLSKAHGSGTSPRDVTEAKAEYAINATAAAILLLVKHSN